MATDIRAVLTNCGVSAQKARLVIDLVRGKPAVEAVSTLKFTNKNRRLSCGSVIGISDGQCRGEFRREPR